MRSGRTSRGGSSRGQLMEPLLLRDYRGRAGLAGWGTVLEIPGSSFLLSQKAALGLWSSEAGESAARGAQRHRAPLQNGANRFPAGRRWDKPGHAPSARCPALPPHPALRTRLVPVGGGFVGGEERRVLPWPGSSENDKPTHSPSMLICGAQASQP